MSNWRLPFAPFRIVHTAGLGGRWWVVVTMYMYQMLPGSSIILGTMPQALLPADWNEIWRPSRHLKPMNEVRLLRAQSNLSDLSRLITTTTIADW